MSIAEEFSDGELIDRFKRGKKDVLGILFTRYTSLVYGTSLKYLKDRDNAKDAVMQIFEKLNETLKIHEISNFKSWLYVLTRNHCLMQLRSRRGNETKEITPGIMESEYVLHQEDESEMEQNLSKLEKCIEELADQQKQCVHLFYIKEKCYKEVSDETGYDMGQVKSFIQNGKRNLKICMERNG